MSEETGDTVMITNKPTKNRKKEQEDLGRTE